MRLNQKNRQPEEDFGAVITGLHSCPEVVLDVILEKNRALGLPESIDISSPNFDVYANDT